MNENRQNTWGDISSLGFGLADFAQSGGFEGVDFGNIFRRGIPKRANKATWLYANQPQGNFSGFELTPPQ